MSRGCPRATAHNHILEEPAMAKARSLVGLDVHAAKIVAAVLDADTGELQFFEMKVWSCRSRSASPLTRVCGRSRSSISRSPRSTG
jgi:hypothetical protein